MIERQRLDTLVWQRGLAPSRAQAHALVLSGAIAVNGQCLRHAGTLVSPQATLTLLRSAPRYVSRGGDKLAAALATFPVAVRHRIALDIGASTGGFTDCLLQAGVQRVYAIDVGYGQLRWRLRTDPRVVVYERTNARYLRQQDLPERASVLTIDVAFISLRLLFPVLIDLLEPDADVIALIKPQFEVGKGQVSKGGVVRHPHHHYQALMDVLSAAQACGLVVQAGMASPLLGPKGNREFFVHGRLAGGRAVDDIHALCQRLALSTEELSPPPDLSAGGCRQTDA
jgi:23S rRNA (cytidine1920-2'-O)/16S rRNA (cytidine1409-2'-O)-methyltransferase